jgi:SSS family solute:Na+ symporter
VLGGVLGVLLAVVIPTVIDSLRVFYAVLGVSLFVPIAAGLHSQRPGVPEALAAIGMGITVLFVVQLSALPSASRLFDPTLIALVASGLAFGAVFLLRRRHRSPSQEAREATD